MCLFLEALKVIIIPDNYDKPTNGGQIFCLVVFAFSIIAVNSGIPGCGVFKGGIQN